VGAVLVVGNEPRIGDRLGLLRGVKQIRVQDLLPVGPIEAFDEGVLHRFAGLDVRKADPTLRVPEGKRTVGGIPTLGRTWLME
jgi:hypothetical protein